MSLQLNQKVTPLPGPENLVTLLDPRSQAAEAYRTLRTNIQFSSLEKPLHTLLVTSPRPDQDKSVTVANLAITFAQMGSRVVLVDADLRRPALHSLFGLSNEQGLTTLLLNSSAGRTTSGNEIKSIPSVANLRVLTSGPQPPNPAEILSSSPMRDLIEQLRSEADYVLFDAPPVLAVTDAAVLAAKLDGALLALRANKTSRDDAREAKEQLEKVHANLIGTILTGANQSRSRYGY